MKVSEEFDKVYDIRLAIYDDIPMIMQFIDKHWRKGHIMAVNRELFEYEYVHGDEVDFVIAIHKERKTLEGIFGFLRCSKERKGDIWGSMWKINEESYNMKLLGIELAKRVYMLTGCNSHIGNGANPKTTIPLRKIFFHEKTAKMKQYYMLNNAIEEYRIAIVNEAWTAKPNNYTPYRICKFSSFDECQKHLNSSIFVSIPRKDEWYLEHRFFKHPVYNYTSYGIFDNNSICKAIFFLRKIEINKASVLRIVDYIGDSKMIEGIGRELKELMIDEGGEYIDFYEYGIDDDIMTNAGFKLRDEYNNIIPNYFEPLVKENVDIWVHYVEDGTKFFKADGDQDRPNIINP